MKVVVTVREESVDVYVNGRLVELVGTFKPDPHGTTLPDLIGQTLSAGHVQKIVHTQADTARIGKSTSGIHMAQGVSKERGNRLYDLLRPEAIAQYQQELERKKREADEERERRRQREAADEELVRRLINLGVEVYDVQPGAV